MANKTRNKTRNKTSNKTRNKTRNKMSNKNRNDITVKCLLKSCRTQKYKDIYGSNRGGSFRTPAASFY